MRTNRVPPIYLPQRSEFSQNTRESSYPVAKVGLNRYGAGGGVGYGAQPQKPEIAILLRAILITKTVVTGFRGEKNEL